MNSCLRDVRSSAHPSALLPSRRELPVPLVGRMFRPPGAAWPPTSHCSSLEKRPLPEESQKVSIEALPASFATQLGVDADCRCAPILRVSAGPGKAVHARFRVSTGQCSRMQKARRDADPRRRAAARRRTSIVTKEEEGRIRGAAFRTTAGLSPCRRQMPRSSLGAGSLMALFAASRGFRYEMSAGTDRTDAFP